MAAGCTLLVVFAVALVPLIGAAGSASVPGPTALDDGATVAQTTSEIQSGETYKRGELLRVSSGLNPGENLHVRSVDSGSVLVTFQANANGVVTIDSREVFNDLAVPAEINVVDDGGQVDRTFTIVSGEISAAFDPPSAEQGSVAQFVITETVGGDEIVIRSDQLSTEELRAFLGSETRFEMPANGQVGIEFEVVTDDWAPPGEYEFTVENVATGRTARTTFQVEGEDTTTAVPADTGEFQIEVEPETTEAGSEVQVIVQGGTPNSRAAIYVDDFGPERILGLFPQDAEMQFNESYEVPTVPLDEEGQWTSEMDVPLEDFADMSGVSIGAQDLGSGAEAGTTLEIRQPGETTTAPEADGGADDGEGGETPSEDPDVATEAETPVRGFFINGDEGPLAPLANMLNLTMIGFLLSVFGIMYQLMEGR